MKGFLKLLGLLLLVAVAYLLAWPVPIDPVAWTPPPNPGLTGKFAVNNELAAAERLAQGHGAGPEAVVVGPDGRIYTGYLDGRLSAIDPRSGKVEDLENTGGRPLGVSFDAAGRLFIADAVQGLMMLEPDGGEIRVLSNAANGQALGFVDDLDLDAQGNVYFSDASAKFGVHQVMESFFEHRGEGALLRYDPRTGKTAELAAGLHFPNGVALGPDDEYLLLTETAKYRVLKYWLKGDKAGSIETFIDNLPGFPDNITFNGRDTYWLALYGPRTADLDQLLPQPFLRKIIYRLPDAVQPAPAKHGIVIGLNLDGEVVANLQAQGPDSFAPVTSVRQHGEWLYLGSLSAPSIARVKNPLWTGPENLEVLEQVQALMEGDSPD